MKLPKVIQESNEIKVSNERQNDIKEGLTYHFSEEEIKALAKFLRKNQQSLPVELSNFLNNVEKFLYASMTTLEIKSFFSK